MGKSLLTSGLDEISLAEECKKFNYGSSGGSIRKYNGGV